METIRIRPLTESDVDLVITAAGGERAHARNRPGADYRLNEAVIELKMLDEEGLFKPERQAKLAALFRNEELNRPVIVLDRDRLPQRDQLKYDQILEGPIKTAVAKARQQLKQSRAEFPDSSCSLLFVVNNGYTALDHESLCQLIARRVRNDTSAIDGIIVAGCYFHTDGFDSYFLCPFEYVPINILSPFSSLDRLEHAWNDHTEQFMTAAVLGTLDVTLSKGPVIDKRFDLDGVTYLLPAPRMGRRSEFYVAGRPRQNTSGVNHCPPVAITFPALTRREWNLFRQALPDEAGLCDNFEAWQAQQARASQSSDTTLKPFAPVNVTHEGWETWCVEHGLARSLLAIREYASALFEDRLRAVIESAHELMPDSVVPERYILAITEEIGQDKANDVSHVSVVHERLGGAVTQPLVENARIFHEYAVVLASAYALIKGLEFVFWKKDLTYGWV